MTNPSNQSDPKKSGESCSTNESCGTEHKTDGSKPDAKKTPEEIKKSAEAANQPPNKDNAAA
jgi:hypothetical protein